MHKKILTVNKAITVSKTLREKSKRIVLVGGCFDILHLGHVVFLEQAKKKGDILFVWVESDEMIKKQKGEKRPIHTQKDRAYVISALACVDYVVLLPHFTNNQQYDNLVLQLKPDIIATTKGDSEISHKKRSAKEAGAKVVSVTKRVTNASTSLLAKRIEQEE